MDFWEVVAAVMVGMFLYNFVNCAIVSMWKMTQGEIAKRRNAKEINYDGDQQQKKRSTYSPSVDNRNPIGFKASFDKNKEE